MVASDLSYACRRSIAVVGEMAHGYLFRVAQATGCENPISNKRYLHMVAVRGQTWSGRGSLFTRFLTLRTAATQIW